MKMNKQLKLFIDTTSHKHLGITLSHDAKWSEHVENIVKTIEQIVHGTEGHMAVYGPVRHQKNIIWIEACPSSKKYYMDRSFWGPYNIFLVTDQSIYCHMTRSDMNYLLYYTFYLK